MYMDHQRAFVTSAVIWILICLGCRLITPIAESKQFQLYKCAWPASYVREDQDLQLHVLEAR
jgi:hypothetical protein